MSELSQPTGYEFRVKLEQREDGHVSGTKWLPQDVLHAAHEQTSSQSVKALLVCWYVPNENGRLILKWQGCQEHDTQLKALAAEMTAWLVAP